MSANTESIAWVFGGLLAGQPPAVAWTILGGTAILGVVMAWWSYQRALVALPLARRSMLCLLRSLLWLGLLVVLAAPTRVRRSYQQPTARPLAVLVDHSASMTAADSRQRRRIDDALRRWREIEPAAHTAFDEVKTFAFADGMKTASLTGVPSGLATDQTKLFSALQKILAEAPAGGWGGVVTLTDGLDTSGTSLPDGIEATTRAALTQSTALFFVPGRNRYAGGSFFALRDFNTPDHVAPRTKFRVEATFDSFQKAARTVGVQFKVNGKDRPGESLRLDSGRRLSTWSAEVEAGEQGAVEIEMHAGDEIARAAVRIGRPPSNRILYFQGALDWSYRFLADILKHDSTFVLTPVFNFPNPNAALPPGALRRMPDIPQGLEDFEIVVLANAAASQFSAAQQAALSAWVRDGGVLLYFTPDDDSTQGFAGSELEKMLPVVFSPPTRAATSASRVLSRLRGGYGSADSTTLLSFEWEKTARVHEIFAEAEKNKVALVSPQFSEYAHVARAKPGADVLARHPTETGAEGIERAILLAIQRYGRGQSGVLTTDALWRWKLNQPADDRAAEIFWQTLFAWLTRERQFGIHFDRPPHVAEVGRETSLRLVGAKAAQVKVEAVLGGNRIILSEATEDGEARIFNWRPPADGFWLVTATDVVGNDARLWLMAKKPATTGELSGTAPDEELLRALATRTGGAVLENAPPAAWLDERKADAGVLGEQREPLWHREWVFATMLGLYGVEMILRRKWRML